MMRNIYKQFVKTKGRIGLQQIRMPFMPWATFVLQWLLQREANTRVLANLLKITPVRIEV